MKKSELLFIFLLVPIDAAAILVAFVAAYYTRTSGEVIYIIPFGQYLGFILKLLPFWLLIFGLSGLYTMRNSRRGIDEFASIFLAVSSGIMLVVASLFLSKENFFSRLVVIYSWIFAIIAVALGRSFIRALQQYLFRYGVGVHRVVIIGNNGVTDAIVKEVQSNRSLGYKLIGLVEKNHPSLKRVQSVKVLGSLEQLEEIIQSRPVDEIILADPKLSESRVLKIINFCEDKRVVFKTVPNLFEVKAANITIQPISGIPVLEFQRTPLEGWGKIIKRLMDIIGSLLLLIIFSPLFFIIAIAIKFDSRGSVLYRQERVGGARNFQFLKFRSMQQGAHKEFPALMRKYGLRFKLKDDHRVTRFGRFLRQTSIDELPQFFNVLRGEMSLVGPRPPIPSEVALYNRWHRKRLTIKPGITGLWQVSGRSNLPFDENVRLDIYYIENWSLWLDIKILLKTITVVFKKYGAY